MKGFVYLIEIAAAALLIVGAIGVLSMFQGAKVFWERPELVSVGNNMIRGLEQKGTFDNFLSYPYVLSDIEAFKPPNVVYGIRVSGTFPSIISIGCASGCDSVRLFLSDSYVNKRRIKFD
ncbi:MAG TPA: hypothetical protein VJH90_02495, partial [archaeon]|nr:hypothetical protein [archaeon]